MFPVFGWSRVLAGAPEALEIQIKRNAAVKTDGYESTNYHKYTYDNELYQRLLQSFLRHLYEMLMEVEPESVLDAGCGEGFVVDYLARQNPDLKLTGVDLSEEAIAYAEAHFGERARFRTGSVYKLPFSDNSFDVVLCSEVLEHLDDPGRAVQELKRVARRHVLITVPREPYFQWLNNVGQWLDISPDPGHVNFWTKDSFQAFVREHFSDPRFDWKQLYQLALAEV